MARAYPIKAPYISPFKVYIVNLTSLLPAKKSNENTLAYFISTERKKPKSFETLPPHFH
jgi:hypothetical protein